jgi:hypothetical protein
MLLQRDVQLHLDDSGADSDQGMRRTEHDQEGRLSEANPEARVEEQQEHLRSLREADAGIEIDDEDQKRRDREQRMR